MGIGKTHLPPPFVTNCFPAQSKQQQRQPPQLPSRLFVWPGRGRPEGYYYSEIIGQHFVEKMGVDCQCDNNGAARPTVTWPEPKEGGIQL
jgi:hypothetical protein